MMSLLIKTIIQKRFYSYFYILNNVEFQNQADINQDDDINILDVIGGDEDEVDDGSPGALLKKLRMQLRKNHTIHAYLPYPCLPFMKPKSIKHPYCF